MPELVVRKLLYNKVEILLPKDWNYMSDEDIRKKYPSSRSSKLVYCDPSAEIAMLVDHTDSPTSQNEIEEYKDGLKEGLKSAYPGATWIEEGVKVVNGKKLAFYEIISGDKQTYNLLFFTDLDDRLLLFSFNCDNTKADDWKPVAEKMMNSVSIK